MWTYNTILKSTLRPHLLKTLQNIKQHYITQINIDHLVKFLTIGCLKASYNTKKQYKTIIVRKGNNPMVGATVAVAVSVEEAAKAGKF